MKKFFIFFLFCIPFILPYFWGNGFIEKFLLFLEGGMIIFIVLFTISLMVVSKKEVPKPDEGERK